MRRPANRWTAAILATVFLANLVALAVHSLHGHQRGEPCSLEQAVLEAKGAAPRPTVVAAPAALRLVAAPEPASVVIATDPVGWHARAPPASLQ